MRLESGKVIFELFFAKWIKESMSLLRSSVDLNPHTKRSNLACEPLRKCFIDKCSISMRPTLTTIRQRLPKILRLNKWRFFVGIGRVLTRFLNRGTIDPRKNV